MKAKLNNAAEMVRKAIDRMRTGRAYDHDGLVAEHFIHVRDLLTKLLVVMFNRAMCEGLPDTWSLSTITWSLSTIVPIFKVGDPMELGNIALLWSDIHWHGCMHPLLSNSWVDEQRERVYEQSDRQGSGEVSLLLTTLAPDGVGTLGGGFYHIGVFSLHLSLSLSIYLL